MKSKRSSGKSSNGADVLDPGVVDEDVDVGRQRGQAVEIGEICRDRRDLRVPGQRGETLLVQVHRVDPGPVRGQPAGNGGPDAAGRPGHERRAPVRSAEVARGHGG